MNWPKDPQHNEEILSWLAEAVRGLVRTDLCIAFLAEGSATVHVHAAREVSREDIAKVLGSLSSILPETEGAWEEVLINGRPLKRLPEQLPSSGLKRVIPTPLSISGRRIGAMVIATWDDLLGPRSLTALKRIATEVGVALQALWSTVAKERDKLEAILENLIDGILLVSEDGQILAANHAARKLARLKRQASSWAFPEQEGSVPIRRYLQEATASRQLEFNRIWRSEAPPRRILGIKGRRIRDAENRDWGWLIQIRDITQSWHAERFRNDVLSVASHEIHTPLTSMNDAVSLLLEGGLGPLSQKQRHLIDLLRRDIDRLNNLVNRLLDVGRYDAPDQKLERRRQLDVVRTLQTAIEHIQYRAARKSLSLVTVIPEQLPRVLGDRDQLIQVVQNLLDNAVKFTPVGGVIEVGAALKGGEIEVWVRDTGIGIPEEYQQWIFEKFTRLENAEDEEVPGHGLGLSIAKAVVEAWGGRIWVESKPGEGSIFRFTIPVPGRANEPTEGKMQNDG